MAALAAGGIFVVSCTKTEDVTFSLALPDDVRDSVLWLEVAAHRVQDCPSLTQMSGGLNRTAAVGRVAFERGKPAPRMKLEPGRYAFSATARNTVCEVLATGCTAVDVPGTDEIAINLRTSATRGGKCAAGAACVNAECIPAESDFQGGACTLEVVGGGPLSALSSDGVTATRPSITALSDGFLIGYGQTASGTYRVTLQKASFEGSPVPANESSPLPFLHYVPEPACPGDGESGGVGVAFQSPAATRGWLVIPHGTGCENEFAVTPIDAFGKKIAGESKGTRRARQTYSLTNHAFALGGYFARVIDGQAQLSTIDDNGEVAGSIVPVGKGGPHALAWVAASSEAVAVLTQLSAATGGDGGGDEAPELVLQATTLPPKPLTDLPSLRGHFASLAIESKRAVVVHTGTATDPVHYALFDIDPPNPQHAGPVEGITKQGTALSADVTTFEGRMYVAAVLSTGISVVAYEGFGLTPKLLKARALEHDSRVEQFMGGVFDQLRDGYVSIAAARGRVGVVWITGQRVSAGEVLGGWAVLACP